MNPSPDLHAHSTASDGTLTPSALMARARAAGVAVMALTDHDTLEGLPEAAIAARSQGMYFVPGVEISVSWGGRTIHVVGLGVDHDNAVLQEGLKGLRRFRDWRAEEMGRRLAKAGYPGVFERAQGFSNGRLIGRTHFARALVALGHAESVRQVFQHFLVRGKPGHVAGEWAALGDAVGWIRAAGGQAVIAHPARYGFTRSKLRRLVAEFIEAGGEGIEVVSGSHNRDEVLTMANLARQAGLLASAGSDYHGPENPWIELGRLPPLPAGLRPIWHDWPLRLPAETPSALAEGS
ncbi:MAG: PHP domain-containing protein [Gammaproteobacteria bacterium]|nr:MAG: PHP domain-containing protein [Gammaproteobacteria bacterium]